MMPLSAEMAGSLGSGRNDGSRSFARQLAACGLSLTRSEIRTVQVNLGKLCNQTCVHCHVDAGPHRRRENMDGRTAQRVLELIRMTPGLRTVDLTGGAPELNPHFRTFVTQCRSWELEVIDRCNLSVLSEPGQEDLAEFLAVHRVRVVASLPCYAAANVDAQRGGGVFARSILGLQRLNELGFGRKNDLIFDLVYNPAGAFLPPPQPALEAEYRRRLAEDFGISFSRLLALTNLPVKRFAAYLHQRGQLASYQQLLVENFNEATVDHLMCRNMISVSWDGRLFDCDFHQMEDLPLMGGPQDIWTLASFADLTDRDGDGVRSGRIRTASHCYGCTAGQGSSCSGAVVDAVL